MSPSKSQIYMNGVNMQVRREIRKMSGMNDDTLPFKYLGITIASKKLGIMDCHILLEKIVERVRAIGARQFSYGGRLILVQTVLSKLHCYWSPIFLIPKGTLKQIDAICRNFLWHGNVHYINPPLIECITACLAMCGGW